MITQNIQALNRESRLVKVILGQKSDQFLKVLKIDIMDWAQQNVRRMGIITCHQRYRPNFEARPSCIIAVLLSMQERTVTHAVFSGIYTSALA